MFKKMFGQNNDMKEKMVKKSYSQSGEDLIIQFILEVLRKNNPSYIDIGANHPIELNNTFRYYELGCRGICIEPDSFLHKQLASVRPNDICLNVGIGISNVKEADFYIMSTNTLNTFSKEDAERYQSYGKQKIEKVEKVSLVPLNEIMKEYFVPDFISLDTEGFDVKILQSIDFTKYRPLIFCIETITYSEDRTEKKIMEISEIMSQHGYMLYGDTYINSIFVDEKAWRNS